MSGSTEEFLTRVGNRVNGDAQTLADATDEAYRDNPLQALVDLRSEGEPGPPWDRPGFVRSCPRLHLEVVRTGREGGREVLVVVCDQS